MHMVRMMLVALWATSALASTGWAQADDEQRFLEVVGAELGKGGAEPIPITANGDGFVRQTSHDMSDPANQMADQMRAMYPTPSPGYGMNGVSNYNLSTDPASSTVGVRLDTAFGVMRNIETAAFLSEHQFVTLTGLTILPWQTPCSVVGLRTLGGYADNMSMTSDNGGYSIDLFFGTRYKKLYHKLGFFIDDYDRWKKIGLAYSALTELPIVGTVTLDSAFGFSASDDEFFLDDRDPDTFQARRVEQTEVDYQIRVGKFWCECFQSGLTGNYYPYDFHRDEYGAGLFGSLYLGRFTITTDVTGGNEGLRGYVRLGLTWGKNSQNRVRDCRVSDVDAVAWVTRATDRDQSVRLRETYSGPIPVAP